MSETIDLTSVFKNNNDPMAELQEADFKPDSRLLVKLFTSTVEKVGMHYEPEDPIIKGYFKCDGDGCPYCRAREKVKSFYLMPVYLVADDKVAFIRVSQEQGRRKLLSEIRPFLNDPNISTKVIEITRNGLYEYEAHALPGEQNARTGVDAIQAFLDAVKSANSPLSAACKRHSHSLLEAVPRIRRMLDVIEGPKVKPDADGIV